MKLFNKINNGIYNIEKFTQIKRDVELRLEWRLAELECILGYKINKEIIQVLATKRLLDCYDNNEIIKILEHYEQLKTTGEQKKCLINTNQKN